MVLEMKDRSCPYQFDIRFAEESAKCPFRSAEMKQGAMFARVNDGIVQSDDDTASLPFPCYLWHDLTCCVCNANDEECCAIERKCIEERFGPLERYNLSDEEFVEELYKSFQTVQVVK